LEKLVALKAASCARLKAVLKVRAAPTTIALLIAALILSAAFGMRGKNLPINSENLSASADNTLVRPTVTG
jgi:hypothetical protein